MNNSSTCPVCEIDSFSLLEMPSKLLQLPDGFKIGKCKSCDLVQLVPRPTIDDYEMHYDKSDYYSPEEYNDRANKRVPIFMSRLREIDEFIGQKDNVKILDYGCAGGHFLQAASEYGWEPVGVEYTDKLAEHARNLVFGSTIFKETVLIKEEQVDVVHSNHVFEHLPNPLSAAKEAYRILKPNGILFIEVPYQFGSSIDIVKLNMIGLLGEKMAFRFLRSSVDPLHHTYFYTPKTLSKILQKAGFDIIYKSTFNAAYYKKMSSILGVKRIPYYVIQKLSSMANRGGSVICVARKP